MKKIFLAGILAFLCSCTSFHTGTLSSSLSEQNLCYVDVASGNSRTKKILLVGGLRKDALVLEAKKQMYLARPLKAGEQYQNITVDFKHTWYFVFIVQNITATVSADVIKFCTPDASPMDSTYLDALLTKGNPVAEEEKANKEKAKASGAPDFVIEGEKVSYFNGIRWEDRCTVLKTDSLVTKIKYYNDRNMIETKDVQYATLFKKSGSFNGMSIGDSYEYSQIESGVSQTKKGIVKGLGLKQFYVEDERGKKQLFFYKK